jgi:TonB family protein
MAIALLGIFVSSPASNARGTGESQKKNCSPPRAIYSPEIPPAKHGKKINFTSFEVLVSEKGEVAEVKVLRSSGQDDFDRKAKDKIHTWKFEPRICDGTPSSTRITVSLDPQIRK